MSDDPGKTLNAKNIQRAIPEVTKWELLGLNLDVPHHKLEEFRRNYPHNITQCKLMVIYHWLNNDLEASWKKLAGALDQEYHSLAERIRREYVSKGARGPSRSQTPSPKAAYQTRTNPFTFPLPPQVIVKPPTLLQSPRNNELEQNRQQYELESSGSSLFLCLFCGISGQKRDMTKGVKRRYVELLQESPSPDKILQHLLQGRLDPFYVGEEGRTILHYAAIYSSVLGLKALVAFRGPDVNPVSAQGTPLDLAGININGGEISSVLRSVGAVDYSTLTQRRDAIRLPRSHGRRMLVLNCSGLSAILHIETLQQLELRSGRKVFESFEWIVASGLSGLFILLMMYGHQSLANVRKLFFKFRHTVFQQKPCTRALESFIKSYIAPEMKMNSIHKPKILLPVMCRTARDGVQTHIFNNCLQDRFSEVPVWEVARYICCHPPHLPELDGYLSSRDSSHLNLSALGLGRARQYYRERGEGEREIGRVLRLKQGQFGDPELLDPITSDESVKAGKCFVLNPILPCPLFLSLSVDDMDVVDCVIETMRQVSSKIGSLVNFLE